MRINKIEDLDEVLQVSEEVFEPNFQEKEKYHKKSDWLEKIKNGLLISAVSNNQIVGFAICCKKETAFHIWNVGVLTKYRKIGIWQRMYKEIIKFAKDSGYRQVSLNTYKEKFPPMYKFCKKEKFIEKSIEVDPFSGYVKSMFIKQIV